MSLRFKFDGFVKKSIRCVVLHLSSLQLSYKYASFRKIRTPCIWGFLLCHLKYDFFSIFFNHKSGNAFLPQFALNVFA